MSDVKYIIGQVRFKGGYHIVAIAFPGTMVHADMAERIFGHRRNVLAAGFLRFDARTSDYAVYGKSESLKKRCRKIDRAIVNRQLGPHYNFNSAQDVVFDKPDAIKELAHDITDGCLS